MLRLGILIEGKNAPAWVNEILQKSNQKKGIQYSILIQTNELKDTGSENILFRWFRKFDHSILPGKPDLSHEVELEVPRHAQVLRTEMLKKGERYSLPPDDLYQVTKVKPDLILYFGNRLLDEEILGLPKLGIWNLDFGTSGGPQGNNSPPGFWEWFYRKPVSAASIVRLGKEPGLNVGVASGATRTENISYSRNQTALYSLGIDLLLNTLEKVIRSGNFTEPPVSALPGSSISRKPDILNSLYAFLKLGSRVVSKLFSKLIFTEQWVLFYSFSSMDFTQPDLHKFVPLIPPKDRIWADPFVVSKDDLHYVFIEELLLKTKKGHINCLVLNKSGKIEASKTIINRPYHLSYPFVFLHEDTWYMIPESSENKTVDLFECTNFPFEWRFKRSLLTDVEAFDSTLHFHEGIYWLFCTIKKSIGGSSDDHLFLFYSTDFLNEGWREHPGNPIVSNPFTARPAGRLFFHNHSWYRPSQICVPRYGYGLSINKITGFNLASYSEENVSQLLPEMRKGLLSIHTINSDQGITLLDGQLRRLRL